MSDLAAPFRQLVERRLWPLALVLLAAAAAVPFLLAKGEEPVPVPPAVSTASTSAADAALATQPIVSVGGADARESRRKVLGSAKNPFKPARLPKKDAPPAQAKAASAKSVGESAAKTAENLSQAVVGLVGAGTTPAVTPVAPKRTFELFSLTVRFGDSALVKRGARNLKRLKALPNAVEPVVIYLGLLEDNETAVFLVDASAKPQGDGRCMPSPSDCQTLHMKVGDIEFFDVENAEGDVVAQYQLDLVKIRKRRTSDAAEARRARASVAKGGRKALRPRVGRVSGFHYDSSSGTVRRKG